MHAPNHLVSLVVSLVLVSGTAAQQMFVVGPSGGPGVQFTQINTAVAAVPDGSVLLVQPGNYAAVVIAAKGVTILANGAQCPSVTIQGTQSWQSVVVRGLRLDPQALFPQWVVQSAAGRVTIDGHGLPASYGSFTMPLIRISQSAQVCIQGMEVTGAPACRVANSRVVFERCRLIGRDFFFAQPNVYLAQVALESTLSDVQFAHGNMHGGSFGSGAVLGEPAAVIAGGSLRILGSATHSVVGGTSGTGPTAGMPTFAIVGFGSVRADPAIPLVGGVQQATLTQVAMPSLLSQAAGPGGVLTAQRFGALGSGYAIAVGLPGPVTAVPGAADPLWLDPQAYAVMQFGVTTTTTPIMVQLPVPNQSSLRGFQMVWQTVDVGTQGIAPSNPSPTLIL
jgi:hypothetical protein